MIKSDTFGPTDLGSPIFISQPIDSMNVTPEEEKKSQEKVIKPSSRG